MNQDNGGIIGKINTPTTSVASGVWTLDSQFEAQSSSIWPLAFPQTTFTNSVRLDTDTTFTRTLGASPTNAKKGTISFWFKKVATPNSSSYGRFVHIGSTGNDLSLYTIDDYFQWYIDGATNGTSSTSGARLYRDHSAWYHIIYAFDSTQATAADRIKIYINGELQDSTAQPTTTSVTLNTDIFDASHDFCIGATNSTSLSQNLDGYLAEFIYIDGQQLTSTSFGATNPTSNIWEPIAYAGTYGTNGFKLNFSDSSALGDDTSGNGNDFTANNLTSIDQTTDTPSNNFATLNPLSSRSGNGTFSEGNTKFVGTMDGDWTVGTMAATAGKWYWEVKANEANYVLLGITTAEIISDNPTASLGGDKFMGFRNTDKFYNFGTLVTSSYSYSDGDIFSFMLDLDAGDCEFYQNDTLKQTITLPTDKGDTWIPIIGDTYDVTDGNYNINFGNPSVIISSGNSDPNGHGNFEYTTKTGYAWNTKNLAEFG